MIKIAKSNQPPDVLIEKGVPETDANKALYDSDPEAFHSGDKKMKIKSSIYGHETVKEKLKAEQSDKCCFCEADFTANGYGDVEHFRPKKGYQQKKSDKLKRPGYYWKAYDWDNLFFSCQICNQRHKKNFFPLEDDNHRAIHHHDDIDNEQPLLIHPSEDNAEDFISFREEVAFPIEDNNKGKKSISAFGINREKLLEIRREYLNNVANNYFIGNLNLQELTPEMKQMVLGMFNTSEEELNELIDKARIFLRQAAKDSEPFAAMVRNKYPDLPRK